MDELEKKWEELVLSLEKSLNDELTLKSILFLIGVQELGQGIRSFDKEEKISEMFLPSLLFPISNLILTLGCLSNILIISCPVYPEGPMTAAFKSAFKTDLDFFFEIIFYVYYLLLN